MCGGCSLMLVLVRAVLESLGNGLIFAHMVLLFGGMAKDWTLTIPHSKKFLFFILPPGAFLCLGLIIAGKNIIDEWLKTRSKQTSTSVIGSKRVRTTGNIS